VQVKTKAGLALVVLGIGVFIAWKWWTGTRRLVPVNVAMPLAAGESVTSPFKLNYDGLYLIEITAGPKIPIDALHCLLGVEADSGKCKDIPTAVGANWVVSGNGGELKRGSSNELHSAPVQSSQGVTRVIGEFPGKAGGSYRLQVAFTADARGLAAANPRLKVAVASIAYTDLESAGVLVFAAGFICVMFGAILLGIAFVAKGRG
jgi:hypothetical protein